MAEERFINETKLVARLRTDFLNSNSNTLSKVKENNLNKVETIKITGKLTDYSFNLTRTKKYYRPNTIVNSIY